MRWLFLSLVVLNVAYVSWELGRERPQQVRGTALPRGVESIVLLSELADDPAQPKTAPLDTGAAAPQGRAGQSAAGQPLSPQPEADQLPEQAAALEPAPPPADAGASKSARESADRQPSEPAEAARTQPAADICYTLGPFKEMETLRLVTREIKDYVVEASFRSKEEQEQTMFRVLISPVGSKQEAKALIRELDKKNIRDHFIITEGPYRNAISLGYFSTKSRAYRHADRVRKLGFDAAAEPVFRSYTIYWLDYRIRSGEEIPQHIFDEYLDGAAQRLSRACG